jgi:hypothetical protein
MITKILLSTVSINSIIVQLLLCTISIQSIVDILKYPPVTSILVLLNQADSHQWRQNIVDIMYDLGIIEPITVNEVISKFLGVGDHAKHYI